jgi:hypothetical protein
MLPVGSPANKHFIQKKYFMKYSNQLEVVLLSNYPLKICSLEGKGTVGQ